MKSKSLTFKIFINTFLVGTLIYFVCAFLFISNMYSYFENQIFSELITESNFLEKYVLEGELDYIASIKTENRITLIHTDGRVYFDNKVDISKLENHGTRQEFIGVKNNINAIRKIFWISINSHTFYIFVAINHYTNLRISLLSKRQICYSWTKFNNAIFIDSSVFLISNHKAI